LSIADLAGGEWPGWRGPHWSNFVVVVVTLPMENTGTKLLAAARDISI
jgi:hypothetical protein